MPQAKPPVVARVAIGPSSTILLGCSRTAAFLVVLTAPWTETDESTRNQLGVGPGPLVLVVQFGPVAWPGPSTRCAKRV